MASTRVPPNYPACREAVFVFPQYLAQSGMLATVKRFFSPRIARLEPGGDFSGSKPAQDLRTDEDVFNVQVVVPLFSRSRVFLRPGQQSLAVPSVHDPLGRHAALFRALAAVGLPVELPRCMCVTVDGEHAVHFERE